MSGALFPNCEDRTKLSGLRLRSLWARDYVKDKSILDMGCGSGLSTEYYGDVAKDIIGLDIEHTDKAQQVYGSINKRFYKRDIALPLSDNMVNRFDTVLMFEVIEHFHYEDAIKVVDNAYKALKPGGLFIGSTPNMKDGTRYFKEKIQGDHCVLYHTRDLIQHFWKFKKIETFHNILGWATLWVCTK